MSDEQPPNGPHEGDDVRAARNQDRTTDAVDWDDRDTTETAAGRDESSEVLTDESRSSPDRDPNSGSGTGGDGGGRWDRIAFAISALIGLVLAGGAVALVSGRAPLFENLLRVRPTVQGGGVAADWVFGNTVPALEIAIAVVHFADVIMGIFILLMVFIHWAAFRRLAARMRPPAATARERESAAATDGGAPSATGRPSADSSAAAEPESESDSAPHDDPTRSEGGESR
ncbi:hypothetical protein [Natrinema sp. SYSU A 869]|uniref:hypothetical protein n=1 Tax=Natrinema sp. SYSU A 869 TaxID=2871694 RepID=UPI002107D9DC|nr:hypothetical protein [Natrinema sp. SYSU A 869]